MIAPAATPRRATKVKLSLRGVDHVTLRAPDLEAVLRLAARLEAKAEAKRA